MNNTIRLSIAAAALVLTAAPAMAYDKPPTSSTPPGGSSGGNSGGSSGGSPGSGSPSAIPEPAAIGLFALGIAGAALIRRSRRRQD